MLNKKLKLFFVFVIGFILLTVVAIGIQIALLEVRDRVYLRGNLNWATNPAYQIFVEEGQTPAQVTCTVMDSQGHPMPGINVALGGYSGTQGEMVTNDQGQVTQSCSASCTADGIIQIWVNGICVFFEYSTAWYQPSCMSVKEGLTIKIIMLDLGNEPKNQIPSQSGIVFPKDALLIRDLDDRLGQHLYYTAKEPFILPENLKRLHSINLKNQDYYLELGDIGNGLSWISDEKPFKLPVDLDELYLQDNKGFASKEALVSRVKELEAKGEEWETHSNLELDEKIFSCYFKTNITGATESWSANWITNNFAFEAQMLKTPEKYYLHLWSREALPSELEALEAKK